MIAHLSLKSRNEKTGPIPVSTTSADTCPDACSLKTKVGPVPVDGGCYAEANFHLRQHWNKVSAGSRGSDWEAFCAQVAALPDGQLWRHNQAGDLPGTGDVMQLTMAQLKDVCRELYESPREYDEEVFDACLARLAHQMGDQEFIDFCEAL